MTALDGCPCGCWQSPEARAMAEKLAAEHQADFERYWEALHRPPDRPVAPDHETDALLNLVRLPVAKVSVVG